MITSVVVTLNGVSYPATYDSATETWRVAAPAPDTSSFPHPGGYYPITVIAENDAGRTRTITTSDQTLGEALRLFVTETEIPVVGITLPAAGSFLPTSTPTVAFTLLDDELGSGINLASVAVSVDGTVYGASYISAVPITHGYDCTFVAPQLADGAHTVSITVADNDGNVSEPASVDFTVDILSPEITIYAPAVGSVTRRLTTTIIGAVVDVNLAYAELYLNNHPLVRFPVTASGEFSRTVNLPPGDNVLMIRAVDLAGNESVVMRTITRVWDFEVITDRTRADVTQALAAPSTLENLKGNYNVSDLNRVERNTHFLTELMREYGDLLALATRAHQLGEHLDVTDLDERYIANVQALAGYFSAVLEFPPLPDTITPPSFGIDGANALEEAQRRVHDWLLYRPRADIYSGEIYAGELQ